MKNEKLTIIKFKDSLYGNVIQNMDEIKNEMNN